MRPEGLGAFSKEFFPLQGGPVRGAALFLRFRNKVVNTFLNLFKIRMGRNLTQSISHREGEPEGGNVPLTDAALFSLDYLAVPTAISQYVTTFYHFRCDESKIRDIQPAAIGHLTLFPYGKGCMEFADGRVEPSHEVNLISPFSVAANFDVDGPFHAVGAALSPLGWASLTGMCAAEHGNRVYKASDHLGSAIERIGSQLCADYRTGTRDPGPIVDALSDFIAEVARPLPPRHADLIAACNKWIGSGMNPELDDLYANVAYSRRQAQRLVERYFGLPPSALARKYRALRAATLLTLPSLRPELEDEIADAFYDQSHMIREIRLFAGRTPSRLGEPDNPFLTEMLTPSNFREVELPNRDHPIRDDQAPRPD